MCAYEVCTSRACVCVCDVRGMLRVCVCDMWRMHNQPSWHKHSRTQAVSCWRRRRRTWCPCSLDRGDFSNFCSSSIFSRESGFAVLKSKPRTVPGTPYPYLNPMPVGRGSRIGQPPPSDMLPEDPCPPQPQVHRNCPQMLTSSRDCQLRPGQATKGNSIHPLRLRCA